MNEFWPSLFVEASPVHSFHRPPNHRLLWAVLASLMLGAAAAGYVELRDHGRQDLSSATQGALLAAALPSADTSEGHSA